MAQQHDYGERRRPTMSPEQREIAVRAAAAARQPNADPEMQLVLYAEALLDVLAKLPGDQVVEIRGEMPVTAPRLARVAEAIESPGVAALELLPDGWAERMPV